MLEVQIYDEIANKSEQVWLSAWGMDDCIFSADVVKRVLRDNPDEKDIKFNMQQINVQHPQESTTSGLTDLVSSVGNLFDIQLSGSDYDPDEAEFQCQQALNRKKKFQKRRGISR